MSLLSCLHPDFIQYLYDNNIKIHVHENECRSGRIRGVLAFLHKYDTKGYISQLSYFIDKHIKILSINWDEIKQIAPVVVFYVASILGQNMNICYKYDNDNDKFIMSKKDCFLCKLLKENGCLLCNHEDSVTKVITSITSQNIINNEQFTKIYNILIPNTYFPVTFIRNYIKTNHYMIGIQEYLHPKVPDEHVIDQSFYSPHDNIDGIYGNFSFRKDNIRIMFDFTINKEMLCIDLYTNENHEINEMVEIVLLHLMSCQPMVNKIMIRHDFLLSDMFDKMGFMLVTHDKELFHVVPFLHLNKDSKNCIVASYATVMPYIEKRWNEVKNLYEI